MAAAFNDYCIVCEKLCPPNSVYCCEECKQKDQHAHFHFANAPQLISPALQPRSDSIASALSSSSSTKSDGEEKSQEEDNDDEDDEFDTSHKHDYLIKSPLLLSSCVKEQPITGLNLNELSQTETREQQSAQLLSTSSNNYKKWLNVVL